MQDVAGAADDLTRLKSLGLLDPLETGMDSDFAALRSDRCSTIWYNLLALIVAKGEEVPCCWASLGNSICH